MKNKEKFVSIPDSFKKSKSGNVLINSDKVDVNHISEVLKAKTMYDTFEKSFPVNHSHSKKCKM